MELKRIFGCDESNLIFRARKRNLLKQNISLLGLYHAFEYGEDYRRPVLIALGILVTSIIAFYWQSNTSNYSLQSSEGIQLMKSALERALLDFFQIRSEDLDLLDFAVRASSIPVLGMIFVTLRRRLERKFRH
jgi:hypothetical protein